MYFPTIYEINTRVWLRKFDRYKKHAKLSDIPLDYWKELADKGIDCIWLMGVWRVSQTAVKKYCFEENLVVEYKKALSDWKKTDVVGSPFAIECYEINPLLGTEKDLLQVKKELNSLNIKLILDFIPNHFSAESNLIESNPGMFLHGERSMVMQDPHTYFEDPFGNDRLFAHGRDPNFPAWLDTVQVNYFDQRARNFMIKSLISISKLCDGVRCDMAMLVLNDVFEKTWDIAVKSGGLIKPEIEFWEEAIKSVKKINPDFIFIAETYWNLEEKLQILGFDFTYDKRLLDVLEAMNIQEIESCLNFKNSYQEKSVRFIENHDEDRAIVSLGPAKSKAAAVIISTIQGMRFFHDGQFEGKRIKLPVQLGREPDEELDIGMVSFYNNLLRIINHEVFKKGNWKLLNSLPSWDGDTTHLNILSWIWKYKNERRLIAVNYSEKLSTCRLKLDVNNFSEELIIIDLVDNTEYIRSIDEIISIGLYVKLDGFKYHIFAFK